MGLNWNGKHYFAKSKPGNKRVSCIQTKYYDENDYHKGFVFRKTGYSAMVWNDYFYVFGAMGSLFGGWVLKSKTNLVRFGLYELCGNLNNLADKETELFVGIDGDRFESDCGFLEKLRNHPAMGKGEKCELLVYLFAAEITYVSAYGILTDFVSEKYFAFKFNFRDRFCGKVSDWFSYMYNFEVLGYNVKCGYDFTLQVGLDKYITNLAEAEVFLIFLKYGALLVGGSWYHIFFLFGEKWYKNVNCFVSPSIWQVGFLSKLPLVNYRREECFNICLEVYKEVLIYADLKRREGQKGIGWVGKAGMRVRMVYWLGVVGLVYTPNKFIVFLREKFIWENEILKGFYDRYKFFFYFEEKRCGFEDDWKRNVWSLKN